MSFTECSNQGLRHGRWAGSTYDDGSRNEKVSRALWTTNMIEQSNWAGFELPYCWHVMRTNYKFFDSRFYLACSNVFWMQGGNSQRGSCTPCGVFLPNLGSKLVLLQRLSAVCNASPHCSSAKTVPEVSNKMQQRKPKQTQIASSQLAYRAYYRGHQFA